VERETAGARKRVEDAETAVQQEQDAMTHAEIVGLTSRKPEKTFQEMLVGIGDSLSDLASSNAGEDGEEEDDEDTEQGNLSEDDEAGWVMGTITKTVQQRMERFRQKEMKLDKLAQPGWEDAADYFREQDKKYGTTKLRVAAIVQPQTNNCAPAPPLVLATGPGNPPAVRVWTPKTGWVGSRTVQKPDPQTLGGPNPDPYTSSLGFRRVWLDQSVPTSGSAFRVSH